MSQYMGSRPGAPGRETADKLKERFQWLESFSDDELREISFCRPGEALSGDEIYFDISHPERGVIQGEEGTVSPEESCYVPRSSISRHLWEKLTNRF